MLIALAFLTSCSSPVNMNGSPPAANAAPSATSTTQTTTPSSSSEPLILDEIPFGDITKIEFKAKLNTQIVGSYATVVGINLNHQQGTFASTVKFTGPTSAVTIGSCSINGTGGDFRKLRDNLTSATLATGESASVTPEIASAELKLFLKNGTVRTFEINNNTDSVSGNVEIDGKDLREQLTKLSLDSSCSSNIDLF